MSPRSFDSDEIARTGIPLRFVELVDCPECGETSDGEFFDDSISVEDIVDPPTGHHACPACGHRWSSELTGWTFYTEAG